MVIIVKYFRCVFTQRTKASDKHRTAIEQIYIMFFQSLKLSNSVKAVIAVAFRVPNFAFSFIVHFFNFLAQQGQSSRSLRSG